MGESHFLCLLRISRRREFFDEVLLAEQGNFHFLKCSLSVVTTISCRTLTDLFSGSNWTQAILNHQLVANVQEEAKFFH